MLRTLTNKILYSDPRYYAAFPSIVSSSGGDVLVQFRRAPDPRWYASDLEGQAELQEKVFHVASRSHIAQLRLSENLMQIGDLTCLQPDIDAAEQDPSLLRLESGQLLLTSFAWFPMPPAFALPLVEQSKCKGYGEPSMTGCIYFPWGCFARTSHDEGNTWSPHCYLSPLPGAPDVIPHKRATHGGHTRGQAVEVAGDVLVATYGSTPSVAKTDVAHLYATSDCGATWHYRAPIAWDLEGKVDFHEPSLCVMPDGRLIAFLRTRGLEGRLATAISNDQGHTWSPWRAHTIVGSPFHPLLLPDGRILLTYGYRHEPYGIRARIFSDPSDLDESSEIVLRDDGANTDVGYPWATQLPSGEIAVVYYMNGKDGIRTISATIATLE